MAFVFLDGEIADEESARISVSDRGLLHGDGLFETMRAYGGKLFRPAAHLARLRASAEFLRLRFDYRDAEIEEAIAKLIRRNTCPDAYVRLTVTRGTSAKGLRLDSGASPTVLINVRPLMPYPPERYRHGVKLVVSAIRQNSGSPLPRHKTLNYLPYLLARQEADQLKHFDPPLGVEAIGGLVEEQQVGVMDEGLRQIDFLHHAGGIRFKLAVALVTDPHQVQYLVGALHGVGARHPCELAGIRYHLHRLEILDQALVLGHVTNASPDGQTFTGDVMAENGAAAATGADQPDERPDQRTLARPVGSKQAGGARRYGERDIRQGVHLTVGFGKATGLDNHLDDSKG